MKNKYIKRSRISEKKFREILRLFCIDIEASKIAEITRLSRPAVNKIFDAIRQRISKICEQASPFAEGEVELDESYFGAKRVRGIRGRGARGKIPVFGMLKRGGKVCTQVVKNCSMASIMPIIEEQAMKSMTVYTDGFKTYDGLADYGYKRHYRVKHGHNEFAKGHNHINGIENFWNQAKRHLRKFNGIPRSQFYLF